MTTSTLFDTCFKDKNGRVILGQAPNISILGWLVCKILIMLDFSPRATQGFSTLGTALLFTWGYLELTSGVTYFRRFLGAAVLVAIVFFTFFKA